MAPLLNGVLDTLAISAVDVAESPAATSTPRRGGYAIAPTITAEAAAAVPMM